MRVHGISCFVVCGIGIPTLYDYMVKISDHSGKPVAKKTHEAAVFLLGPLRKKLISRGPQVGKPPENPWFSWLLSGKVV